MSLVVRTWHNFIFSRKNYRGHSTSSCPSKLEFRCRQDSFHTEMSSKKCFDLFLDNQFQKIHMLDQVLGTILFSLKKIIEVTVLPVAPPNWNLGVGRTVFTLKWVSIFFFVLPKKKMYFEKFMLDQELDTILFSLEKIIEVLPVAPPNWNLGVGRTVFTMKWVSIFFLFVQKECISKNSYVSSGTWHNFIFSRKNDRGHSTSSCPSKLEFRCRQDSFHTEMSFKKCFEFFLCPIARCDKKETGFLRKKHLVHCRTIHLPHFQRLILQMVTSVMEFYS